MRRLQVETIDGFVTETVYDVRELSLLGKMLDCKESQKRNVTYLEIPCAFDIETTNVYQREPDGSIAADPRPYAFMYHWQFCIDDQVTFGRTWNEFIYLLEQLKQRMNLKDNHRLVIWCHNLAFEFQFFRRFVDVIDGFYKDPREPLKVVVSGGIEFRDSYALSNMTLQKFCENEPGVKHYKLSGDDYDYDKIRTADTPMSDYELSYCYNDVRGLCECISSRMQADTLAGMPMTATGYVRRDARGSMKQNPKNRKLFTANKLSPDLYRLCREAFRGGDTHANIHYADQIVNDVKSYDIQSSYPACMMMNDFPQSAFFPIKATTFFNRDLSSYAQLIHIRWKNIRYVGKCGIPYIALAKCRGITSDRVIDNGRVLYAGIVDLVITDIDFKIILNEYIFDDMSVNEVFCSRYAPLASEYKAVIMQYFRSKTKLKGDPSAAYEYMKSKNRLNSLYGMMCQRIDHDTTVYDGDDYVTTPVSLEECIAKYYKSYNSFLSYQHGVWVTAHARSRLREMLQKVGKDVVYCDTDSIKFIGDHKADFDAKNAEIKKKAKRCGAYAKDKAGKMQYLGLWENETEKETYSEFKTLGAKKYVYVQGGKVHSTIAGVSKKIGANYFNREGIDSFRIGARITDSGHLTAYYNDDAIHYIDVDGCRMLSGSNVALVNNSYTIGVTDEYLDLLEKALAKEDNLYYI